MNTLPQSWVGHWGSGKGIYNYEAQADYLLTIMWHRAERTGPQDLADAAWRLR
jgi:hypothetical protein